MDGAASDTEPLAPAAIAEGGFKLTPAIVDPITNLFKSLMDEAQGKTKTKNVMMLNGEDSETSELYLSLGSFLRKGLDAYWAKDSQEELERFGKWSRKRLEEAIFTMYENTQRTHTSANDLMDLDYSAESEYRMFPGEEITIAKGYSSVVESLASVLPPGVVQLGRKVTRIEWKPHGHGLIEKSQKRPVKLHFCDGSVISADHVIITVSLGVLKAAIREDSGMFYPPLPLFKAEAISRLGFGVVNKLFLQQENKSEYRQKGFPFLQMVFHPHDSELRNKKIPWWVRRTATLCPIYRNSSVLLAWFAGEEALALESLNDEEMKNGVSATISSFLCDSSCFKLCNNGERSQGSEVKFSKVLKSKWGSDPLFLGSYSYVAVGSSGDDLDTMAEPLPRDSDSNNVQCSSWSSSCCGSSPPLQILFAGEATHRTHYSTTHGAYFSGLREANRLLQHYHCVGIYNNQ